MVGVMIGAGGGGSTGCTGAGGAAGAAGAGAAGAGAAGAATGSSPSGSASVAVSAGGADGLGRAADEEVGCGEVCGLELGFEALDGADGWFGNASASTMPTAMTTTSAALAMIIHGRRRRAPGPGASSASVGVSSSSTPEVWSRNRAADMGVSGDSAQELCATRSSDRYESGGRSTKREKWPWNPTSIVLVGPFRCLATMKSARPARGLSAS